MGNVTKTTTSPTEKPAPYQEEQENEFLAVLDDYPSPDISQPVFSLGEKLRVISNEGGWWRVISLNTGRENYIPAQCVAKVYHGWLFDGVGREKAEELLQLPDTKTGSYMIRQSENKKGLYSLSVRHRQVKHYRIFRLPNNWYYISPRLTFQCLEHLVDHYSETADGLCCVLTTPCLTQCTVNRETQPLEAPVVMRRNQFNWRDTKRLHLNHEGTRTSSENDDSLLSYGLRQSIASYMSLVGDDRPSYPKNKKKDRRSQVITGATRRSVQLMSEEDYELELPSP
ncbi:src-like-adapter isoform X2 [Ambystoma mexicanum]|uniref:src-like-adapter isoform X2 n=1 Tax=Ambystoma mexicanum TaxID=8296 RepID=UPI0037E77346